MSSQPLQLGLERRVLLARPNRTIVDDMEAFLEANGFTPVRLATLEEAAGQEGVVGVVISTAIVSEVMASYAEVFDEVRRLYPSIRIAFATLLDLRRSTRALGDRLGDRLAGGCLFAVEEASLHVSELGTKDGYLVLHHHDTTSEEPLAGQLVSRHFG